MPANPRAASARAIARFGARGQIGNIVRKLYHLCCHAPHWRVGWRLHDGPGVLERGRSYRPQMERARRPGRAFLRDPFPISRAGGGFCSSKTRHRVRQRNDLRLEFGRKVRSTNVFRSSRSPGIFLLSSVIEAEANSG